MKKKIAIVGLGWLGLPLAKSFSCDGYDVIGSTTRAEKLMRLLNSNLSIRIIKLRKNTLDGNWNSFINGVNLLIINVPPGKNTNSKVDYPQMIQQIITRCEPTQKVIFVSSTGVYKSSNSEVSEDQLGDLDEEGGAILLEAEQKIRNYFGENATIVRFAGLIGEDRHPAKFIQHKDIISNPNGRINMIRREDCIHLIRRIYEQNYYGHIINACANEHPTRQEFYTKAALSANIQIPAFDQSTEKNWKIVSNEKSKKALDMDYSSLWDAL